MRQAMEEAKKEEKKEEKKEQAKSAQKAVFVRDVNFPDGETVFHGQEILKEWEFVNPEGAPKWVKGTKLVFESGHQSALRAQEFEMPCMEPGQKFVVTVPLVVPEGDKLFVKFHFVDEKGIVFGDRCWADLLSKQKEQKEPAKETPAASRFSLSSLLSWSPKAEEPKPAEKKAEPEKPAEPKPEPKPVESKPAESKPAEPKPAEPKPAEKPAEPKPEAKKPEPPVFSGPYGVQLLQLHNMGFTNAERNVKLLESARGNIGRVVNWLLELPQ
jgi:hypothetical protein